MNRNNTIQYIKPTPIERVSGFWPALDRIRHPGRVLAAIAFVGTGAVIGIRSTENDNKSETQQPPVVQILHYGETLSQLVKDHCGTNNIQRDVNRVMALNNINEPRYAQAGPTMMPAYCNNPRQPLS